MWERERCMECWKGMEKHRLEEKYGSFGKLAERYEKLKDKLVEKGIVIEEPKHELVYGESDPMRMYRNIY